MLRYQNCHCRGLVDERGELSIPDEELYSSARRIQDRIDHLDGQINCLNQTAVQINEDTTRLQGEKINLKRRLNSAQAATRWLPPELLSYIFQLARPPIDLSSRSLTGVRPVNLRNDNFHFNLAAVSHHWRQVVWSTPQLWNSLSVQILLETTDRTISLLNLYFQNALDLPMSVEIDFRFCDIGTYPLGVLVGAFTLCAPKIKNLVLLALPQEWTPHIIAGNLSKCVSLSVCQRRPTEIDEGEPAFHIGQLPHLQHITLFNVRTHITLPWSSIRVLNLVGMYLDVCLEALFKCPNLLECSIRETFRPYSDLREDYWSPTRPTTFESLESLVWSGRTCQTSKAFIRYCRFAKLHTLNLIGSELSASHCKDEVLYQELLLFFQNLPSTLTSISLGPVFPDSRRAKLDTFLCIPQLTELTFIFNNVTELISQPITELIDDEYTPHRSIKYHTGARVLPSLSKLHLYIPLAEGPEKFLQMIERIHKNGTNRGQFHITVNNWGEKWDQSALIDRLRPLVTSGFDLKLIVDYCQLDFS